jgi:hypothetical protein
MAAAGYRSSPLLLARRWHGNYLGILLDQPLAEIAPEPGRVLVVTPAALLHEQIPQPHGQVLYDLVTGHPDRAPRELVFLAELTVELRAWPRQTWTAVGVSPEAALLAVVDRWRAGHVRGVELGGVSAEGARAGPARHGVCAWAAPYSVGAGDQPPVPAVAAPD